MATEWIQAADEERRPAGVFARHHIHERGLLHETFHCWLVHGEEVLLQTRSSGKKDFPGLLDISAAGHLLAGETVQDGVRELYEELGVRVDFNSLVPLGVIKDEIRLPGFIDKEWTHVYLLEIPKETPFILQEEEVERVEWFHLEKLQQLWAGQEIQAGGRNLKKTDIVPHEDRYMLTVFDGIQRYMALKE
ncbi:NUDIX hydrolase [Planococcus lenghuensis]|uniref:Nudix hydrolase domain-containing protein n=1 Tax=Planococcus lenghuensis TaxID=2213202 RepID=A0A1Q2KWH2_9BACL|nr:NUDIX domain-containing protein [Planococcus lenghuensis]AQQ52022.1 hypothetical protein B0X71_02050 [Planococcus lenghuensis]